MNQCPRNGFSTCSVYHLVGPLSFVAAFAPMNGFVAAARLKQRISKRQMVSGLRCNLLLSFFFSFLFLSSAKQIYGDSTRCNPIDSSFGASAHSESVHKTVRGK